jgi:hypothetical protein
LVLFIIFILPRKGEANKKGQTALKHQLTKTLGIIAISAVMNIGAGLRAEMVDTRIGKLAFELGVPTEKTVAKLYDEMDFQRAASSIYGRCPPSTRLKRNYMLKWSPDLPTSCLNEKVRLALLQPLFHQQKV